MITDAASFVRRRIFEPFGKLVAETDVAGYAPPVLFTGKRYLSEVGMYDFGARWYDAGTAAFGSVDPIVPDVTNPLAHNGYSYVVNRPMTMVDPSGAYGIDVSAQRTRLGAGTLLADARVIAPGGSHAMAKGNAKRRELTERERYWRGHLRRIEATGVATKAYGQRHGLSVGALYQARKQLVHLGAWPEGKAPVPAASSAPTFTALRVVDAAAAAAGCACRVRLADGTVVEWSAAPGADVLVALLARSGVAR